MIDPNDTQAIDKAVLRQILIDRKMPNGTPLADDTPPTIEEIKSSDRMYYGETFSPSTNWHFNSNPLICIQSCYCF